MRKPLRVDEAKADGPRVLLQVGELRVRPVARGGEKVDHVGRLVGVLPSVGGRGGKLRRTIGEGRVFRVDKSVEICVDGRRVWGVFARQDPHERAFTIRPPSDLSVACWLAEGDRV